MAKIGLSTISPETHFTYNELDYKRGSWEIYYSNKVNIKGTKNIDTTQIKIGIRNTNDINRILQSPLKIGVWKDLNGAVFTDFSSLLAYLIPVLNFKEDVKIGLTQKVGTFGDLTSGTQVGDLAYVEESQGTEWLPSTLGGTYYPAGWYVWNGTDWVSDRDAIANQLEENVLSLSTKSDLVHDHEHIDIVNRTFDQYLHFIKKLDSTPILVYEDENGDEVLHSDLDTGRERLIRVEYTWFTNTTYLNLVYTGDLLTNLTLTGFVESDVITTVKDLTYDNNETLIGITTS